MPLTIPNSIDNDTPADAAELQENFTAIRNHININTLHRDGSVAMDQALVLPGDPTQPDHAANKGYVDGRDAAGAAATALMLPLAGGTVTGQISGITPTAAAHLARKDYVDSTTVYIGGDTMTGPLLLDSPQSSNPAAAVRYDWLAARENLRVSTAGDTMTGILINTSSVLVGTMGSTSEYVRCGGNPANDEPGVNLRADGAIQSRLEDPSGITSTNLNLERAGATVADPGGIFVGFYRSASGAGATVNIGTIRIRTGGSAVDYNETSDYRMKDVLGDVDDPAGKVLALQPRHLAWKTDGSEFDGFLAHEVAEVIPYAVTGDKDAVTDDGEIDPQQLAPMALIPLLTAALQNALERIAALEAAA